MSGDAENVDIREMLELQLAEVEMLESMFANPGEFTLDSQTVLDELRAFVDDTIKYEFLQTRVGFSIKILTSAAMCQLELVCNFPHEYPLVLPEVFIRAPAMDRQSHRHLSEDLHEFIASLETGQILVGSVVEWLQENSDQYLKKDRENENSKNSQLSSTKEDSSFTRLWIYSHHIYSKFKRRDIVDWAGELGLCGFSMPGKPGVICVEGTTGNVDDFWYRIRRLNWKRIMIKEQEVMELEGRKAADLCKLGKFRELDLEVHGGKGRSYHMDLGKFKEFLQDHDSAYMFAMYFGVDGTAAGD